MTASAPTRTRKRNRVRCPGVNSMGVNAVCVVCAGPTGGHGRSGAARMYALTCHAVFPRLAGGSELVGGCRVARFFTSFSVHTSVPEGPPEPPCGPYKSKGYPKGYFGAPNDPLGQL